MYFYYSVQGGKKSGSENKEKIVIIDDPVSSMDSNALFIVGSLVRQMIQACESRWTYDVPEITPFNIAQMFILTHNVPFHRDITQNMEKYEHRKTVKFFLVRKVNNESSIKTCTRPSETSGIEEDYNPVKNSYTVLWNEYQELNSAASVMHVIHQILESYFIQLCGYDIETFSDMVLKKILEKHTPKRDDGSDDLTLYTIAQSLLSCFNIIPSVIDEGLSLIDDLESLDHFRDAFKLIFTAMEQDQHYEMMMHAAKELSDNPTIS